MSSTLHDLALFPGDLAPARSFFVGIDSDGCVFDTMELKQRTCFCPNFIDSFGLQAVSGYAREAWEFVNLHSRTRGCNRYEAVLRTLELLREHPGIKSSPVALPKLAGLATWLQHEPSPGLTTLRAELDRTGSAELELVYLWSIAVDEAIGKSAGSVPPFPLVRESLEAMRGSADIMVISQTPSETLRRDWAQHGLDGLVRHIAGQEAGTKSGQLRLATEGMYSPDRILMIGDAPGDLEAARRNGALFYPIQPGNEVESWRRFHDEALGRFFEGSFTMKYQEMLLEEFSVQYPSARSV